MKCGHCKKSVAAGAEAQKMVIEYSQPDGSTKIFGYQMPDGALTNATGYILRAWHSKCYWIERKRELRGDVVTGRVLGTVPTAYDIESMVLSRDEVAALGLSERQVRERGTWSLTERVTKLREIAKRIGKGVGDATVLEAYWAEQAGGPYAHQHHLKLDAYQLNVHLVYAHGETPDGWPAGQRATLHDRLHAQQGQDAVLQQRQDDPGHVDPEERDWRDQHIVDIGPGAVA